MLRKFTVSGNSNSSGVLPAPIPGSQAALPYCEYALGEKRTDFGFPDLTKELHAN